MYQKFGLVPKYITLWLQSLVLHTTESMMYILVIIHNLEMSFKPLLNDANDFKCQFISWIKTSNAMAIASNLNLKLLVECRTCFLVLTFHTKCQRWPNLLGRILGPNHFWRLVQPCVNFYHKIKSNNLHLLRIGIWLPHYPLYGSFLPFIHPHSPILFHDQSHEMFPIVQLN